MIAKLLWESKKETANENTLKDLKNMVKKKLQ